MAEEKPGALALVVAKNAKTTKKQAANGDSGDGGGSQTTTETTTNGYDRSVVVSALQKAIRRNKEPEALYWASELMASNGAYQMWRRLVVIAAEDVGLADPDMVVRIWTLKQAHDFGREWNIPFLAVMLLCRAPKNREADDASYLYEIRRKKGWKMRVPPEAVDGHTREGRTRLYRTADRTGENWETVWNREFYYDAALLNDYRPDTPKWSEHDDPYRRRLMEFVGLPYRTYDLETCPEPRLLTGGASKQADESAIASRIPNSTNIRKKADENGEAIPGVYEVESFTTPGLWYEVNNEEITCSCPAFQKTQAGVCKHLLLSMREYPT